MIIFSVRHAALVLMSLLLVGMSSINLITLNKLQRLEAEVNLIKETIQGEQSIGQYLLEHKDDILKTLEIYQSNQTPEELREEEQMLSYQLYHDSGDPNIGNAEGEHVLVLFIDYNYIDSRYIAQNLEAFLLEYPEAKIIIKEYPVEDDREGDDYAAKMGSALFYFDPHLYEHYLTAVLSVSSVTPNYVNSVLSNLGVLNADLEPYFERASQQINKAQKLGALLEVKHTPTIFICIQNTA